MAVPLHAGTLSSLSIPVPSYDRSKLTPGIVHIGVGGIQQSPRYIQRLPPRAPGEVRGCRAVHGWRRRLAMGHLGRRTDALRRQDEGCHVLGPHCEFLFAPEEHDAVVARLPPRVSRRHDQSGDADSYREGLLLEFEHWCFGHQPASCPGRLGQDRGRRDSLAELARFFGSGREEEDERRSTAFGDSELRQCPGERSQVGAVHAGVRSLGWGSRAPFVHRKQVDLPEFDG
mmetsp:Transcript_149124/g.477603  ORF Transcript_149124/g.477603 Transcript_149124/m.477603 type:complete len:230 (+) Transcript_149124:52-741(+)